MKYSNIIIVFLLFTSVFSFSQEKTQKYSKAKIYYSSSSDLELLSNNGLTVDHGLKKKNIFIESIFSELEIETAKKIGFQVDVIIDDMQKHIANVKRNSTSIQNATCSTIVKNYVTPANFELGSMGGFYTYTEMLSELDDMHTLYPNLITSKAVISNFKSYENRDFHFVKISDNPTVNENEPEILFTAIHHAREPASMQQLVFYMWYLLENYATNPEIQSIVDNTQQYFIPIINVDGYVFNETTNPNGGGMWRKNRRVNADNSRGVDNNRNYSYHWGESGVSTTGSGETWAGTHPFSESENLAIKWFCEQHNFQMALNNHTYSELLLYPFGYASNTPTLEQSTFEAISALMVQENGYANIISSELYPAAGDSDDWMYGDTSTKNKIYAMTPEIGASFWPNQNEIIPICKNMLFHNISAAHLITNFAVIEDETATFIPSLTASIDYSIKRLGLQGSGDFNVTIVPISANITNIGAIQNHVNMALEQENNATFSIVLDGTIQNGDEITYKIIVNNGQFDYEQEFTKIFGSTQVLFSDNGNTINNFASTNWGLSTAEYHSPPSSITDSVVGDYNNSSNNIIELANTIDLTDVISAKISFYAKWNIESGWDYVQFEVSNDNGATWTPQCGKYTKNGNNQQNILNEPMYDGVQNTWVKEEIDLSDYLNENIKFRLQIVSDNYITEDGFYFDDVEVSVLYQNVAHTQTNELLNFNVYPNPFTNKLSIEIPNITNKVSIKMYSVTGKQLLEIKTTNPKTILDMNNYHSGIYFIKITTGKTAKMVKVIKQ